MTDIQQTAGIATSLPWQMDWRRVRAAAIFSASIVTGLLFWQFCSTYLFNPQLLPPPARVAAAGWQTLLDGESSGPTG